MQTVLILAVLILIFFALFGFDLRRAYQFVVEGNLDIFRSVFN